MAMNELEIIGTVIGVVGFLLLSPFLYRFMLGKPVHPDWGEDSDE